MNVISTWFPERRREASTDEVVCPRCTKRITESLGPINSSLDWFRCVLCRHIWATHPSHPPRRTPARRQPTDE